MSEWTVTPVREGKPHLFTERGKPCMAFALWQTIGHRWNGEWELQHRAFSSVDERDEHLRWMRSLDVDPKMLYGMRP